MSPTTTRLRVLGPAAAVLGYVAAVVCLVVGLLLLASPRPEPVALQDGTGVVPGAPLLHPGTAVLVPAGTPEEVVTGLGCEATTADGARVGDFFQGLPRRTTLADGTAVEEVLTASGVRGGDTVTCPGAGSTDVWLAQDGSARTSAGVAALVLAPAMAVGATILLLVGLAARRRS